MNTFSIVLTVAVVFLIMASVIHSLFQKLKDFKNVVKELERELANKEINISYLVKHSQELANILQNNTEIQNKIDEAKTDEEINNIVAAVVAANNDRVQDNKAKGK